MNTATIAHTPPAAAGILLAARALEGAVEVATSQSDIKTAARLDRASTSFMKACEEYTKLIGDVLSLQSAKTVKAEKKAASEDEDREKATLVADRYVERAEKAAAKYATHRVLEKRMAV